MGRTQPSTEISAARQDELDAVLRVMCAAFELPYDVARPIYYADPYFDADNKRVLRVDGEIVSCLTLTSARCRIGKAELIVAGIAGVATLPEHQRKGYATQLITATLGALRTRGPVLVGLFPYDYAYYRRLGWETASVGYKYTIAPAMLPAYSKMLQKYPEDSALPQKLGAVQPAVSQHQAGMAKVYEECAVGQALWAFRDAKRWQYVFDRVVQKYVYLDSAETVEGYLLYDIQPGSIQIGAIQKEQPPVLRILEFCTITVRARRGLTAHMAAQHQVGAIEYIATPRQLEAAGLLPLLCPPQTDAPYAQMELTPSLMLRVVDFTSLLQALSVNWDGFLGELVLAFLDYGLPQYTGSVRIIGNGSGVPNVEARTAENTLANRNKPKSTSVDAAVPSGYVAGDVGVWSQVVVGHVNGEDACMCGRLRASSPEAANLVGMLFPARSPFLPAPDHF